MGRYVLDFYCHEPPLGIEIDGGHHATERQASYDASREKALNAAGIRVLRFWDHEVLTEIESVLEVIWQAVFGDE